MQPITVTIHILAWGLLIIAQVNATPRMFAEHRNDVTVLLVLFCLVNLAYVFRARESDTPSRLSRLVKPWMDAKENELRKRVGADRENSTHQD